MALLQLVCVVLCLSIYSNAQELVLLNNITLKPNLPRLVSHPLRPIYLNPQIGGQPGNPGFQIRISSKGLRYANSIGGNLMNSAIRTLTIADVKESVSKGYVEAKNMRVAEFQPPTYSYSVTPANQIGWSTSGGKISVKGSWEAKKRYWFFTFRGSGTFSASASNIRISVSATFTNSQGKPELTNVRCSSQIGDLSLSVKGGIVGWIINIFRRKIARKIKPSLESGICTQAKRFVSSDVNAKLRTFPMNTRVGSSFRLDYSLISDPKMSSGSVASSHKGEIKYKSSGAPLSFHPHAMQVSDSSAKMVYFYGSDYILNSLFSHAHRNRMIIYTINEKTSPKAAKYLRTTCTDYCLGTLFPEIGAAYPNNSKGSLKFHTTAEPTALFSSGKAILRALGNMTISIQQGPRSIQILTANVSMSIDLQPRVTPDFRKVTGTVKINDMQFSDVHSTIKELGANELQESMEIAAIFLLEPQANEYLEEGLVIPLTRGVQLRNARLRLLPRTAELSADVTYSG